MKLQLPETGIDPDASQFVRSVQTARDLCRTTVFVEVEARNREVFNHFEKNPELTNIPVLHESAIVGLINRDKFMRSMARRFHWELYASKRCGKMMDVAPLVVEAETPVTELADELLAERFSRGFSDGFVVKDDGQLLGIGLTSDVMAALLVHQRLMAEELTRANDLLRELSIKDQLTGLHNRRHLDDVLSRELNRAFRQGHALGMIVVDIDHFKKLNDSSGHQAGDEALRQVASTLNACLRRSSDYCFRFGGEEFVILLTDTSEGIDKFAEMVRRKVEARRLANPGHPLGIVTISLGVTHSISGDSPATFVARADDALYAAKAAGRNRVAVSVSR